jgi:hypothetical protein
VAPSYNSIFATYQPGPGMGNGWVNGVILAGLVSVTGVPTGADEGVTILTTNFDVGFGLRTFTFTLIFMVRPISRKYPG